MLMLKLITTTLSFNVLPLTVATAIISVKCINAFILGGYDFHSCRFSPQVFAVVFTTDGLLSRRIKVYVPLPSYLRIRTF